MEVHEYIARTSFKAYIALHVLMLACMQDRQYMPAYGNHSVLTRCSDQDFRTATLKAVNNDLYTSQEQVFVC